MAYTPTQAGIVNRAASLLGATSRIIDIEDSGSLASHARAHWNEAVEVLFASHPWNFAIARATLNQSVGTPDFGFDYRYALPADCLRVLPADPTGGGDDLNGQIEGGYVLSDDEEVHVRYISKAQTGQVASWPPHVRDAMACVLTDYLAEPLTGSQEVSAKTTARIERALAEAKRVDGMESNLRDRGGVTRRSRWLTGMAGRYDYDWR
jgi:hypothetical protein